MFASAFNEINARLHEARNRERIARQAAEAAFRAEIEGRLDVWVRCIDQADTSDPSWTLKGFTKVAQECWDRYKRRITRINKVYGVNIKPVIPGA